MKRAHGKNYTINGTVRSKQDRKFLKENDRKKKDKTFNLHFQRKSHVLNKTDPN